MFYISGLDKQSRLEKALQEFFFSAFPHDLNLCPVQTLSIYGMQEGVLQNGGMMSQLKVRIWS